MKYLRFYVVILSCGFILLSSCSRDKLQWRDGWRPATPMGVARAGAGGVEHDGVIYIVGGVDGRIFLRTVEYARINPDGTLTSWKNTSILPQARGFADVVYYQGYLYVAGGANGDNGKNLLNTVVRAQILPDGDLAPWESLDNGMLLPRRCSKLFVYENALYSVGGFAGTLLDSVEKSLLDKNGLPGTWQMESNTLTMPRYINALKQKDRFAFVLGGHQPDQGKGVREVEWARLDQSPLVWKRTSSLKKGRYGLSAAVADHVIFVMGGLSGSQYLDDIEWAPVLKDGGVDDWHVTTALPVKMANFVAIVRADRLYVIGGVSANSYHNQVYIASIKEDGRLGSYGKNDGKALITAESEASETRPFLPNSGVVSDILPTDDYTYIKIKKQTEDAWLAAPATHVEKGQTIRFSQGTVMSNFKSKNLNRTFEKIIFVSQVDVVRQ